MRWIGTADMNTPQRLRVLRLMETLERGPAMDDPVKTMTEKEAGEHAMLWLRTWVIPEVKKCFPDIYDRQTGKLIPKTRGDTKMTRRPIPPFLLVALLGIQFGIAASVAANKVGALIIIVASLTMFAAFDVGEWGPEKDMV